MSKEIDDFVRVAHKAETSKLSYWISHADSLAITNKKPYVVIKNGGSYQVLSKDSVGKTEYVYCTSVGASDSEVDND